MAFSETTNNKCFVYSCNHQVVKLPSRLRQGKINLGALDIL